MLTAGAGVPGADLVDLVVGQLVGRNPLTVRDPATPDSVGGVQLRLTGDQVVRVDTRRVVAAVPGMYLAGQVVAEFVDQDGPVHVVDATVPADLGIAIAGC